VVIDTCPPLLREINESEKLMAKANYYLDHDKIVGSMIVFVEEEDSLKETTLDESYHKEIVKVMSCDVELVDPFSIESVTNPIPLYSLITTHSFIISLCHGYIIVHLT